MVERGYIFSLILRLLAFFLSSFIHVDEIFQSQEIMIAYIFGAHARIPWEFADCENPIRSLLPIGFSVGVPVYLVKVLLGYLSVPVTYSVISFAIKSWTFLLTLCFDFVLIRVCKRANIPFKEISYYFTFSWVLNGFGMHTFSNVFEGWMVMLIWWAYFVLREKLVLGELSQVARYSALLGGLVGFGAFVRFTLPLFIFPVALSLSILLLGNLFNAVRLKKLISANIRSISTVVLTGLSSMIAVFLLMIVTDSLFFGRLDFRNLSRSSLTWTSLNGFLYNMDENNLSLHGLHPRYNHAVVNMNMLYGPIWVAIVILSLGIAAERKFPKLSDILTLSVWGSSESHIGVLSIASVLIGLLGVSFAPHQEARFLIPLQWSLVFSFRYLLSLYFRSEPVTSYARGYSVNGSSSLLEAKESDLSAKQNVLIQRNRNVISPVDVNSSDSTSGQSGGIVTYEEKSGVLVSDTKSEVSASVDEKKEASISPVVDFPLKKQYEHLQYEEERVSSGFSMLSTVPRRRTRNILYYLLRYLFPVAWLVFNLVFFVIMVVLHNAAVLPTVSALSSIASASVHYGGVAYSGVSIPTTTTNSVSSASLSYRGAFHPSLSSALGVPPTAWHGGEEWAESIDPGFSGSKPTRHEKVGVSDLSLQPEYSLLVRYGMIAPGTVASVREFLEKAWTSFKNFGTVLPVVTIGPGASLLQHALLRARLVPDTAPSPARNHTGLAASKNVFTGRVGYENPLRFVYTDAYLIPQALLSISGFIPGSDNAALWQSAESSSTRPQVPAALFSDFHSQRFRNTRRRGPPSSNFRGTWAHAAGFLDRFVAPWCVPRLDSDTVAASMRRGLLPVDGIATNPMDTYEILQWTEIEELVRTNPGKYTLFGVFTKYADESAELARSGCERSGRIFSGALMVTAVAPYLSMDFEPSALHSAFYTYLYVCI